jgi:hypothetical protein
MRLKTYLSKGNEEEPKSGTVGKESKWMLVGRLNVKSGILWIGDPEFAWAELDSGDGCEVKVPPGKYVVEAKGIDFDGARFVAAMRAYLDDSENLKTGKEIGEAGTDTGQIGVADPNLLKAAWEKAFGGDEDKILEALEDGFDEECGIHYPKPRTDGCIVYVPSGFGDGGGPVCEIKSGRKRVGIEASFIESAEAP